MELRGDAVKGGTASIIRFSYVGLASANPVQNPSLSCAAALDEDSFRREASTERLHMVLRVPAIGAEPTPRLRAGCPRAFHR